jgi:hypothetical protein
MVIDELRIRTRRTAWRQQISSSSLHTRIAGTVLYVFRYPTDTTVHAVI